MDLFSENIDFMLFESLREDGIFLEEQKAFNKKRLKRLLAIIKRKYKGFDRGKAEKIIRKHLDIEKVEIREAIEKLTFEGDFVKAMTRMDEKDAIEATREIIAALQEQGVEFYDRSGKKVDRATLAPDQRDGLGLDYDRPKRVSGEFDFDAFGPRDQTITTQVGGDRVEVPISTQPREVEPAAPAGPAAQDELDTRFLERVYSPDGSFEYKPMDGYTWRNKDDTGDLSVIPIPPEVGDPDPEPPESFSDWLGTTGLPTDTDYDDTDEWFSGTTGADSASATDSSTTATEPLVRISPELTLGDIGAYKFMGQTKTIGDPTDKKVVQFFEDSKNFPMTDDAPELYAGLVKNYAMDFLLRGKIGTRISEEDGSDSNIDTLASEFAQDLFDKNKLAVAEVFNSAVDQDKTLRQAFEEVERKLSTELGRLKDDNKKNMKASKQAKNLTKNYKTFARLTIKLANTLMEAFTLMYKTTEQSSAPDDDTEVSATTSDADTEVPASESPSTLSEGKLVEIVIDFKRLRKKEINESFLAMFGGWVEHILKAMFGELNIPVSIRGTDREVQSFAAAIGSEKRYIDVAKRYGLDHPSTYRSKAQLDAAAKNFQRETGIKWPFK